MNDQHPIQRDSEVTHQGCDCLARLVHEGERPRQHGAAPVEVELGNLGLDAGRLLETRLMARGKCANNVGTQVVPGVLVALARVAQPDNECR
jgi:hypothetical protein